MESAYGMPALHVVCIRHACSACSLHTACLLCMESAYCMPALHGVCIRHACSMQSRRGCCCSDCTVILFISSAVVAPARGALSLRLGALCCRVRCHQPQGQLVSGPAPTSNLYYMSLCVFGHTTIHNYLEMYCFIMGSK